MVAVMRGLTLLPAIAGLWLLVGLMAPSAARAGYWEDFKDARDAVDAEDWQKAETLLRSAVADNPEPRKRPLSSRRYVPYYYLGVVLQEQGDCPGALEAWKTSRQYGVVKAGSEESQDRAKRVSRCEKLLADVEQAVAEATQAVGRGNAALKRLDNLSRRGPVAKQWQEGSPSFAARRDELAETLSNLAQVLPQARTAANLDALGRARRQAEESQSRLSALAAEAESLLGEADRARSEAGSALENAMEDARQALEEAAPLAPYPDGIRRRVNGIRSRLQRAEEQLESAGIKDLQSMTQGLERRSRVLRSRLTGPPNDLLEAAEAFLNLDFQGALDRLDSSTPSGPKARFHTALLRAACQYQLYVGSGLKDAELMSQAEQSIRQGAELNTDQSLGRPSPKFHSPAFLAFYQSVLDTLEAERLAAEAETNESDGGGESGNGSRETEAESTTGDLP